MRQQPAGDRAENEPRRVGAAYVSDVTTSSLIAGQISDIGRGNRRVGACRACDQSTNEEAPRDRRECHYSVVDCSPRDGSEKNRTPPESVAQSAEYRSGEKLSERV